MCQTTVLHSKNVNGQSMRTATHHYGSILIRFFDPGIKIPNSIPVYTMIMPDLSQTAGETNQATQVTIRPE